MKAYEKERITEFRLKGMGYKAIATLMGWFCRQIKMINKMLETSRYIHFKNDNRVKLYLNFIESDLRNPGWKRFPH